MAVYVDTSMPCAPSKKWPYKYYCHMTADTPKELHEFATKVLGLKRAWF